MKRKLFPLALAILVASTAFSQSNVSYNANSVPIGATYNTAFGFQSLTSVTGTRNSALGYEALKANTSGLSNTGIGFQALTANTVGAFNTAIGMQSMNANISGYANSGLGYQSLYNTTTGTYNTATGLVSMNANTTGNYNTGNGTAALYQSTTGNNNTASGAGALYTNTTGSANTAIGYYADVTTGNLTNATAIGNEAKVSASNTIQLGNSAVTAVYAGTGTTAKLIAGGLQITGGTPAVGKVLTSDAAGNATWQTPTGGGGGTGWSLLGNAGTVDGTNFIGTTDNVPLSFRVNNQPAGSIEGTNNGNTCLGYQSGNLFAGAGARNTALGYMSMQNIAVGFENAATGYYAMRQNTNGSVNTAHGFSALMSNLTGFANTAVGGYALISNTSGHYNTSLGGYSMTQNTTGQYNTAVGHLALELNTIGTNNTAIGAAALEANLTGVQNAACGWGALISNTSGNQSTGMGSHALWDNTVGTNNSALGYYANVSVNNLNNATALGASTIVNASNKVRIGNTTVTVVEGPVAYTISDGRFKTQINQDDVKGLDFIQRLRPVVYNMDTRKFQEFLTQNMADSTRAHYLDQDFGPSTAIRQSGFIAQEVEQAARESGYDFNGVHVPTTETDNYSLAYSQFVVPLVKGMQEQQAMIEAQSATLAQQQSQIEALQLLVAALAASPADKGATSPATTIPTDRIAVYPNPSSGTFTVSTQTIDEGRIEITNASGQVIQTRNLTRGTFNYTLDLTTHTRGIYLVKIITPNQTLTQKLILE